MPDPSAMPMAAAPSFASEPDLDAASLAALVLVDVADPTVDLAAVLRAAWADLAAAVPELAALAMDQGGRKLHKDNVAHTIQVVAKMPPTLALRLAALFHDVGKPPTRVVRADGTVTFHQHEAVGARITRSVMERLGFAAALVERVARIVELSGATKESLTWSDAAVRRFVATAGDDLDDLLEFAALDVTSRHMHKHEAVADQVAHLRARLDQVAALDAERARRPVVNGAAIMARYHLEPGPRIGVMVRILLDAQRDTPDLDEAGAWALLDRLGTARV